jgi:hypothetical protein
MFLSDILKQATDGVPFINSGRVGAPSLYKIGEKLFYEDHSVVVSFNTEDAISDKREFISGYPRSRGDYLDKEGIKYDIEVDFVSGQDRYKIPRYTTLYHLELIRDYYNGGAGTFDPTKETPWCIITENGYMEVLTDNISRHPMYFRSKSLADLFLKNFEKELEVVKMYL